MSNQKQEGWKEIGEAYREGIKAKMAARAEKLPHPEQLLKELCETQERYEQVAAQRDELLAACKPVAAILREMLAEGAFDALDEYYSVTDTVPAAEKFVAAIAKAEGSKQ